jgi:hypothetical protein
VVSVRLMVSRQTGASVTQMRIRRRKPRQSSQLPKGPHAVVPLWMQSRSHPIHAGPNSPESSPPAGSVIPREAARSLPVRGPLCRPRNLLARARAREPAHSPPHLDHRFDATKGALTELTRSRFRWSGPPGPVKPDEHHHPLKKFTMGPCRTPSSPPVPATSPSTPDPARGAGHELRTAGSPVGAMSSAWQASRGRLPRDDRLLRIEGVVERHPRSVRGRLSGRRRA